MEANLFTSVSKTSPQSGVQEAIGSMMPTTKPSRRDATPLVQTKLTFKSIPREAWLSQESKRCTERCEERKDRLERLKIHQARMLMERREAAKLRKRAERERRKKLKEHFRGSSSVSRTLQVSNLLNTTYKCVSKR